MKAMNWERLNALRHGAAYAYDELPRTGSYHDRARYFGRRDGQDRGSRDSSRQVDSCGSSEFAKRIHGVTLFVKHMETPAYRNRPNKERDQVKASLRDAVKKMLQSDVANLYLTNSYVRKAASICGLTF